MCTPDILADRFPSSTYDTPTSTRHVIIARAELRERPHFEPGAADEAVVGDHFYVEVEG
jgi:hypothetical protein